jgi:hypothetical protein
VQVARQRPRDHVLRRAPPLQPLRLVAFARTTPGTQVPLPTPFFPPRRRVPCARGHRGTRAARLSSLGFRPAGRAATGSPWRLQVLPVLTHRPRILLTCRQESFPVNTIRYHFRIITLMVAQMSDIEVVYMRVYSCIIFGNWFSPLLPTPAHSPLLLLDFTALFVVT